MPYDPGKLYELVKALAPDDPSLLEEVRLAAEEPTKYFRRFRKRLAERGIEELSADSSSPPLPWIALVDGLLERGRLLEFDWREDPGTVMVELNELLGDDAVDWNAILDDEEDEYGLACREVLVLAAKSLRENGLALVCLDIESDCYPVLAVPLKRLKRIQRLARESGYGKIIKAEELLE